MTQRISPVDPSTAEGSAKTLLDGVASKLGSVPNVFRTMAQSPSALEGYLGFSGALAEGKLDAALREQIALAVAGANGCDYCASAHSFIAKSLGVPAEEAERNLAGEATDARTAAALKFAEAMVIKRARLEDSEIDAVREAGFDDGEIVEIMANVVVNVFTNYFNHLAGTEIDFPTVTTGSTANAA